MSAPLLPTFMDALNQLRVYEQVDRIWHPFGWGHNLVRFVPLELAKALPCRGQA